MSSVPVLRNYIGGRFVANASGERSTTSIPRPARSSAASRRPTPEVEQAVAAAQAGFAAWSALTGAERGRVLQRAAAILRERNREIAELEVRDTGKPIQEAEAVDVAHRRRLHRVLRRRRRLAARRADPLKSAFVYTRREPLGVCVGIGAWNYPIQIACWKSAPALACGNAMIFKPSEMTPLTAAQAGRDLHRGRPARRRVQRRAGRRPHRRAAGRAIPASPRSR